jgi:protein-disulfide isomerase
VSKNDKAPANERAAKVSQMRKEAESKEKRTRNIITAAVLVLVVALLAGLAFAMKSETSKGAVTPGNTTSSLGHVVKAAGAKPAVKLDIYEDFQCPHCKTLEDAAGPVINKHIDAGDLQVNYHMMSFLGPESTRAAAAGACFADAGVFRQFHSEMYANQAAENSGAITTASLKSIASRIGGAGNTIGHCVSDNTYRKFPERVNAEASDAGVSSTPTIFLDGEPVEFTGDPQAFDDVLTAAIAKAAPKPSPSVAPQTEPTKQ